MGRSARDGAVNREAFDGAKNLFLSNRELIFQKFDHHASIDINQAEMGIHAEQTTPVVQDNGIAINPHRAHKDLLSAARSRNRTLYQ